MEQIAAFVGPPDRHEQAIRRYFARSVPSLSRENRSYFPTGIPDLHFTDPNFYKDAFGTEGKDVFAHVWTALPPNKGIENVIQALPSILSRHSNCRLP